MVAFKRKVIYILTFVLAFLERKKKERLTKTSEVSGGFYLRLNFSLLVRTTNQKMFNGAAEDFSHR